MRGNTSLPSVVGQSNRDCNQLQAVLPTADVADDSEGIGDLLQLLPETVRAAVQTYLASQEDSDQAAGGQQLPRSGFSSLECFSCSGWRKAKLELRNHVV